MSESTALTEREGMEASATDPSGLIKLALEKGVDVDVLERLVSLSEHVSERNARMEFFAALNNFQERCPPLVKSSEANIVMKGGNKYGYTYAALPEIARTVRPVLHAQGLSYSWTTEPSGDAGTLNVVCILRHVEGHEERATFPVPTDTRAAMSAAQKNGAALTYGQRQSLVSVLGITATDDVDGADGQYSEPISPDQIEKLNKLVTGAGADFERFLIYMDVESLDEIVESDFAKAEAALRRKAGA